MSIITPWLIVALVVTTAAAVGIHVADWLSRRERRSK